MNLPDNFNDAQFEKQYCDDSNDPTYDPQVIAKIRGLQQELAKAIYKNKHLFADVDMVINCIMDAVRDDDAVYDAIEVFETSFESRAESPLSAKRIIADTKFAAAVPSYIMPVTEDL